MHLCRPLAGRCGDRWMCASTTHPLAQNQSTRYERWERLDLLLNVPIFEYERVGMDFIGHPS